MSLTDIEKSIVHEIIDVISGVKNLSAPRAAELHEQITPGYNDKPLTAEEIAKMAELQARQDRLAADQAARAAAAAPPAAAADAV